MTKSFSSLLLAFILAVSMALTQTSPAYADVNLPAEINQQFTPLQIDAGGISVLKITIFNPNSHTLTSVGFTDNLFEEQEGLFIVGTVPVSNSCGGSVTFTRRSVPADANDTIITLSGGTVPAETTVPGECSVEVNVSSIKAGNLINTILANALTATGSGGVTIHNTSPASATITVIAVDPPSMSKTFAPNTIYIGQTSVLTIRINNNDPDTNLTNVSFTDNLPSGVTIAGSPTQTGCGATPTTTTTSVALSGGTITPAIDCVIKVNVTGTSGIYTNSIPAGPTDPDSLHTQQGVTNDSPVEADLNIQPVGISKAFSTASMVAGDTTTLVITLTNPTGTTDYMGVGISDTLPAGLTFTGTPSTTCISAIPPQTVVIGTTTIANDTITLANGTIPAASPGTCTITATVKAGLTASGTLTNTILKNTLIVAPPNAGVTNVLPAIDDIIVTAALTGTKSYTAPYAIGTTGTNRVTITLRNNSSTAFTNVYFTDNMPANLNVALTTTIPAAPADPVTTCGSGVISHTPSSVTLTSGTIAANSSCTVTFYVTSSVPGSGTTYENSIGAGDITACSASSECVGNNTAITTGTDLTVVNATELPVSVRKAFSPAAITPGQTSRLTITLTAPLDIGINGIYVKDTFPTGMTVASTPNIVETCPGGLVDTTGGNQITFTNLTTDGLLAAGASCTISVDVTAAPGIYPNTIAINTITTNPAQARTNELTAANDTLTVTSMTMKKAFYPTAVQAEGKSTLTITLQNTSDKALTNVNLTDNLPGNTTNGLIVASTPTTTCSGGSVTAPDTQTIQLSGSTVPAQVGAIPGICTITVDIQGKGATGSHPNSIPVNNVTATDGNSGQTVNPLAPANATLVIQNLKIGVVKGFNPVLVYGGATSTLTVKLINPNSVQLTGISFTDDLDYFYTPGTSGMKLANPPMLNTGTCGGTLSGTYGASSFSFSGGVLQPNSSCIITLKVIMVENGSRTNKIPIGAVTTFNGVKSDQPTQASLTNLPGVGVTKTFSPNPAVVGVPTRLTINITNTSTVSVVNMGLVDNFPTLPTGLAIAPTPNASNNCAADGTAAPLIANPGEQSLHLSGGGLTAMGGAHATCTVGVDVVASSTGSFVNTIPLGRLTADDGVTNKNSATDTLRVGELFSLGNRVWFDTNNDGLINTDTVTPANSEVGVDGVTVQLYSYSAVLGIPTVLRDTQVTSGGGYYRFDDLETGDYVVVIPKDNFTDNGAGDAAPTDPLKGYLSSNTTIASSGAISDATSNDPNNNIDSDENGITQTSGAFNGAVISNPITLGPNADEPTNDADMPLANPFGEAPDNQSNRTVDFGFYRGSIGNLVFLDANGNGTYGGSPDSTISGATVQLFASNGTTEIHVGSDGILGTADDGLGGVITDTNGGYLFSGLPEGIYVVKVTSPAAGGYSSTTDSADTTNPDLNINNNDNGVGIGTGLVSSNPVILTPGDIGAGPNNTVTQATGTTYNPTMDFGFQLYSLGNRVWYDTNNDGVLNAGESGISGVRVELYDSSNNFLSYDETDANGYYRFDMLAAGDYVVRIPGDNFRNVGAGDTMATDPLAGYWSSGVSVSGAGALSESATNDPDNDRDASSVVATSDENGATTFSSASIFSPNPINYVSSLPVTLGGVPAEPTGETAPNGQGASDNHANMTVDFGFYRTGIGDLVFVDFNENGGYDTSIDTPLDGAIVKVFTTNDTEIPVGPDGIFGTSDDALGGVTTGTDGLYSFSGLPAGDYVMKVTPPAGYSSTVDTADNADTFNPDTNTNNNDNGIGLAVGQAASGELTMTPGETGTNITSSVGTTTDTSVDFGFISPYYSLGNRVWFDTNNNGSSLDTGEVGVDGVLVQLYAADVVGNPTGLVLASMLTANGGYYRFDNLSAGDYVVMIPNDNFTTGGNTSLVGYWSSGTSIDDSGIISDSTDIVTSDPDTDAGDSNENGVTAFTGSSINYVRSAAVTLGGVPDEPVGESDLDTSTPWGAIDSRSNLTVDFGFYRTAIGDLVFVDADKNGAYLNNVGAGEIPLSGATVQLFSGNGVTQIGSNVTTDGTGLYAFTDLPQGNYIVKVTPPLGYASTVDTADNVDTTNPDTNTNNNDNGIGEVIGALPSSSGQLTMTPGETGTNITVVSGNTTDTSVDFGFVPLRFSLGNRVWYDTNNNSLLDGTEFGINGVRVQLFNSTGTEILVGPDGVLGTVDDAAGGMLTKNGGYYRFDNLLAGDYIVRIPADNFRDVGAGDTVAGDPLKGYRSSGTTISGTGVITDTTANDPDDNIDSDDNGLTTVLGNGGVNYVASAAVTLGPDTNEPSGLTGDNDPITNPETGEAVDNQSNRTVDFGFYRVEIGNLVYVDENTKNGTYDAGETLLSGATVLLYASNGTTQINVGADGILGFGTDDAAGYVTGAGGTYSFTGLPAGDYIVRVTPPAVGTEYASTMDTAASTDTTDPDYNVDNNDNGIGENAGQVSSGVLTMSPGGGTTPPPLPVAKTNVTVTNATAITADTTVDFGFVVSEYFLGNRVWFDTNNNNSITAGEMGISGVRVELYFDTNGNNTYNPGIDLPVAASPFVNTDANGYYRFDNLAAGNYIVVIPNDNFTIGGTTDALVGYWSSGTSINNANTRSDSTANDPDTTATDSDENGRTTFASGAVNYVASAAVTLGSTAEPIGETDPLPTGNQGTPYDNRANMTVDFGFYHVEIGNLVFVDADSNGAYVNNVAAGEIPFPGATVQLFASNGTTQIGSDIITDATGLYLFNDLPAGDYIVRVTPPSGFISTIDTAGTADPDSNVDNDDNGIGTSPGLTTSGVLTMTPGQGTGGSIGAPNNIVTNSSGNTSDPTVDFGFTKVYSLGNRVWLDTNNNGAIDGGELGVSGVLVELYRDTNNDNAPDGASIANTLTDASGYYRFDNLTADNYIVRIPNDNFTSGGNTSLVGYWSSGTSLSTLGDGVPTDSTSLITNDPDDDIDSNENGVTTFTGSKINYVSSAAVTLGLEAEPTNDDDPTTTPQTGEAPDNRSNRTVDFGFYRVGIGDLIFVDSVKDGANGVGDSPLNGATVQVYASNPAGTTTTLIPVGADGILGTSDDGPGGFITKVGTGNGIYSFTGLPAGDYIVRVTPPVNYVSTVDTNNSNDTTDPDYNANNNDNGIGENALQVSSGVLTMTPGGGTASGGGPKTVTISSTGSTTDNSVDFGFVTPLYNLGNRVWLDTDNDGVIDAGESGVDLVRVQLFASDGITEINVGLDGTLGTLDDGTGGMFTANGGYYRFDGLPAGSYIVRIANSNFTGAAPLVGYWSTGTSVNTSGILSESATPNADTDADDATSNPATSDENGATTFSSTSLASANPINYVSSSIVVLGPDTAEPTGETDLSPTGQGTLDNRANMTVDFGFYSVGIGDLVFIDAQVAGISDGRYISADDGLLSGALVELISSDSSLVLKSMTTGINGLYSFSGLPAGDYRVRVTPPANFASTVDTYDSNDTTDPDYNTNNNDNGPGTNIGAVTTSGTLTMTPGGGTASGGGPKTVTISNGTTTDNTVDFGFNTLTFNLGNRVWYDTNNDGVLDAGENGISGVSVEVYVDTDSNGVYTPGVDLAPTLGAGLPVTVTTDSTGHYRFDGLPAGNYVVVIPSTQFTGTAPLLGYWSSGTTRANNGSITDSIAPDPDTNIDANSTITSDENGATTLNVAGTAINYVSSAAITLGPATDEPTGETDLSATGQGNLDNRANMTVDFGFYTVKVGDLTFVDLNVNGEYLATDDAKLSGAIVELFAGNGTTSLGSVTTIADGSYSFSGLPEGNYIIKVTPPSGFVSTDDRPTTANPDNNTDNDDNGPGTAIGQVTSGTLVMNPGEKGASITGVTADLTVDFGFKDVYSLGNRVWFDTNNNSTFDSASEVGIRNVVVELYHADLSGYPTGAAIDTTNTDSNGYYRFDNLPPANYVVVIPADNFIANGTNDVLVGYWSSGTTVVDNTGTINEPTAPEPETSTSDVDDNGTRQSSGTFNRAVISAMVTLGGQAEPTSDSDPSTNPLTGEAPNNQSNRTVDFGFYRVAVSNQIFVDLNENGSYNVATDLPLPYATVKLFASNGTTEIAVGSDGILGTADDGLGGITSNATGNYLFTGLPQGDYIVKVTPPTGYSSTTDASQPADTANPNTTNNDDNDNGVGTGTGETSSHSTNLSSTTPNTTVDNSNGTITNTRIDFGFTVTLTKTLVTTNAVHTINPNVAIGETITYDISMFIPVGTMNNVTVVDTPQTGLAFVDCINITLPAGVTSVNPLTSNPLITSGTCNTKDGTVSGTSNPLITGNGGVATFNFGNITNASTTPQLVTIRYSLIVLDIATNQNGDIRTNNVTWHSDGGTKTVNATPIKIVEPEITIDKSANPTAADYGTIIPFTIDIAHTAQSSADAFDVVVTDQIPAGLTYVTGSVNVSGTSTPTSTNFDVATNTLTVRWDEFHLIETAKITYRATFVGPAPVINSASMEWTSLSIDPLVDNIPPTPDVPRQLSDYNTAATERWYDPSAPASVNNYQALDSVTLTLPAAARLPRTGFAPNTVTELPSMPAGFSYAQTGFWIEIPSLKLKMDIVGVPFDGDKSEWNLTWLASNAGWLENTAYPTHAGNSAITAHTTLASGLPGPFAKLESLIYGDQVIVHLNGQKYIYEVRENKRVRPDAAKSILKHEDYPWLTLITCKTYDESTREYTYRTVVRAVLVKLVSE